MFSRVDVDVFVQMGGSELSALKHLIDEKKFPINTVDSYGNRLVHVAIMNGRTDNVAFLVSRGCDIEDSSPLELAVLCNTRSCAAVLLRNKANVNVPCGNEKNLLMGAIKRKLSKKMIKLLLNHGSRIYQQDEMPWLEELRIMHVKRVTETLVAFIYCCRKRMVSKDIRNLLVKHLWDDRWNSKWRK
jgi:ankyrin repeat protein